MAMVEDLVRSIKERSERIGRKISPEIIDAFLKVPRHLFTPRVYEEGENGEVIEHILDYNNPDPEILKKIYSDMPLAIIVKGKEVISTSSQPFVMAFMLEDAKIKKGMKVLEIGTGSGYNAAIIAQIVGEPQKVITIEIKQEVAELARENLKRAGFEKVKVITGDGGAGYPEEAPYDSILATCSCPEIPWMDQLAPKGTIAFPLITRGIETLVSLQEENGILKGSLTLFVRFLRFEGVYSAPEHFAREIRALQRLVEKGEKRKEIMQELEEILLQGDENEKEKREKAIKRAGFEFFLAITEPEALVYESGIKGHERGYALWHKDKDLSKSGIVVLFPDEIVLWGNKEIEKKISRRFEEWKNLGEPGLRDYEIAFYPNETIAPLSKNQWSVPRRRGTTIFSLKK
ncbi:protein-L-isoaspartate O-methyltransferase [candidate division WOR-3 bacterium]|nr:protein-L-isoaspartate O-methyltransferase [candidate division WOR-3 bacterium]